MWLTRSPWRPFRRSSRDPAGGRITVPPTADEIWLDGTAERQVELGAAERSPTQFRLVDPANDRDEIEVLMHGVTVVGFLDPEVTRGYRRFVRRATANGRQVWVHGQVVRVGVDLCVVLHCPPRWPLRRIRTNQ
ncbi:MAG: hypothetical protein QOH56_662 [Pseudonocardiales bacterium]|jgi:hypothetical protein|nr:hypothetical protein [Frankiales bacterium]MDQ1734411.1 hypothetical protein [Pseudonocardiales bacterium]